jgi:hypothetical protein
MNAAPSNEFKSYLNLENCMALSNTVEKQITAEKFINSVNGAALLNTDENKQ